MKISEFMKRCKRYLAIGSPWPDKDCFKRLNQKVGSDKLRSRKIIKVTAQDSPNVRISDEH